MVGGGVASQRPGRVGVNTLAVAKVPTKLWYLDDKPPDVHARLLFLFVLEYLSQCHYGGPQPFDLLAPNSWWLTGATGNDV